MGEQATDSVKPDSTFTEQWLLEQQNWQQLLQTFADSAAQDENFLMHVGNAMRGSLLAGKPYPGSSFEQPAKTDSTMANDEVVFGLRRLEGKVDALIAAVDALARPTAQADGPTEADRATEADGPAEQL